MALEPIPGGGLMGYNIHGDGFTFPLYGADDSLRIVYIPIPLGSTCAHITEAMEARGTRRLFVASEHTEQRILSLLNTCAHEQEVPRERVRGPYVAKPGWASRSVPGPGGDDGGDGIVCWPAARVHCADRALAGFALGSSGE
jgi:hypothetical protein